MPDLIADCLIEGIGRLYTLAGGEGPRRGSDLREVGLVEDGAVASHRGKIVAVGTASEVRSQIRLLAGSELIDAEGRAVIPGFVDPHTHAVFGVARSDEFGRRLVGETYQSIAASGGGIRSSVRDFRSRDPEELLSLTRQRMFSALRKGTTTMEVKSGYGLDLDSERKALEVVAQLSREPHLPRLVATCLAAHEFPDEWREDRDGYVTEVCEVILPTLASEGLAERADVFCEPGVFTVEQARRVLSAARKAGLRTTVHADELDGSGGAELAAEMGADSADHLGRISEAGIAALAASETVGVLLPGTIFSLGLDNWAPARAMIDAGAAVALATDFNPGSNYCESMPLTLAIACTRLRLHPHEALNMATRNSAHALGRAQEVGSLEPGKSMDCLVLNESSVDGLCHHLGLDPVVQVILRGETVWVDPHPGPVA